MSADTGVVVTRADAAGSRDIASLFNTPQRYMRSVHLERDFHDTSVLRQYVLTDTMHRPFQRIIDGLGKGSTRRAWRITGDYGTGKSSFALVLAHLLRTSPPHGPARDILAKLRSNVTLSRPLLPVLVTGRRSRLVPAIAEAAVRSAEAVAHRDDEANEHFARASDGDVKHLLRGLQCLARSHGGVLLVLDELGKFLEHAAAHPEHDEVFSLQELAEHANGSGDRPLLLVGLLHQGLHAYTDGLPAEARLEWEKVSGRYEELTFDQPLPHTMALTAAALGVRPSTLPSGTSELLGKILRGATSAGWGLPGTSEPYELVYPLHPTVLPVLVRFFARFGQHERSLYNFLLSHEMGGLQDFALRPASTTSWYTVADFFEYVRAAFGHSLGGGSYQSYWSRLVDTIDSIGDLSPDESRVLRAVALLNVVDAEHMRATHQMVTAALWTGTSDHVSTALAALRSRGVLFERPNGDLRLWPPTSINLQDARNAATAALGPPEAVSKHLPSVLKASPILARRHAIETGTLRSFDVRYVTPEAVLSSARAPSSADGLVLAALCETEEDRARAIDEAAKLRAKHVLLCISAPLGALQGELHAVRVWQWVLDHTPELAQDGYARTEAERLHANAVRALSRNVAECLPVKLSVAPAATWYYLGKPVILPRQGVTAFLSEICHRIYHKAPYVSHELLNRQVLSSAGAAARSRLIERMFSNPDQAHLGLDATKAPPERSMYLSVLARGNIHRETSEGRFAIAAPPENADPLNLLPVLDHLKRALTANVDARVGAQTLLKSLSAEPFGVRAGLAVVLLAILVTAHGHQIAVYEDGTFLPRMDAAAFLRLTKAPDTFQLQWSEVSGLRIAVFARLAEVFSGKRETSDGLLDVVRPLCVFVAQELPDYTRRTTEVSDAAIRVREVLASARDPGAMLFRDLPAACGFEAFGVDDEPNPQKISDFVDALRLTIEDLREAYPKLLRRIESSLLANLRAPEPLGRARLASTARGVAARAKHDLTLTAFAHRLADEKLPLDPWLESIGSTVASKPPRKWLAVDEQRFRAELLNVAERYRRLQRLDGVVASETPVAFHVGLTNLDGYSCEEVVDLRPDQRADLDAALERFSDALPADRSVRLVALSQLLWNELHGSKEGA